MASKKSGKKRRADDIGSDDTGSDSDSSADEQDLQAFHKRMNDGDGGVDQESGGRLMPASPSSSSENESDGDGDVDTSEVDTDELSSEDDDNDAASKRSAAKLDVKVAKAALDAKVAKMRQLKESLDAALSSSSSDDDDDDVGDDSNEEEESDNISEGQVSEDDESSKKDAGNSVQESVAMAETEKRGKKRSTTNPPSFKGDSPRKKMAKSVEPAFKLPDYSNMQDVDDESARKSIRSDLKSMSIEEMQKLKEEIGLKLFNKAVRGDDGAGEREEKRRRKFPRENKNRPREMSAKRTVGRHRDVVGVSGDNKDIEANKRDPRFDTLCGNFDQKLFRDSYKFVDKIKSDERKKLAVELAEETDPEEIKKIKYLIQRYDNQIRERANLEKSRSAKDAERAESKRLSKEEGAGDGPAVYTSKREARNRELVAKFEDLQKGGKLDNYMRRKNKKQASKDRKRMGNS